MPISDIQENMFLKYPAEESSLNVCEYISEKNVLPQVFLLTLLFLLLSSPMCTKYIHKILQHLPTGEFNYKIMVVQGFIFLIFAYTILYSKR